jgi:hypothetical protein
MALTFSQGRQSGQAPFRSRYADLSDLTAEKVLKPIDDFLEDSKQKEKERVEAHKEARGKINAVSTVNLWDDDYDYLRQKAEVLASEDVLDKYMATKDGAVKYEQLVQQLNDEITLQEEYYKRTHGTAEDKPTSATYEAQLLRQQTPNVNAFAESGFEPTLTVEETESRLNQLNTPSASGMKLNDDGEWEWTQSDGETSSTQKGVRPVRENLFDPGLQEMDVSGFTFFRNRDDGKFDDFTEVEQFIKTQVAENPALAKMALTHYENQNEGLETGVVTQNQGAIDQYLPRATELWIEEARAAFNEKKQETKPTEADKRRADAARQANRDRQLFYDSIAVVDTEQPTRAERELGPEYQALAGTTGGSVTKRTITVPLSVQGSVALDRGDEKGQMIPQQIVKMPNGAYKVTGAYSAVDKNTNTARDTETIEVTLNPNNLSDMGALSQIFALANAQAAGGNLDVSLQEIFEDPTAFDIKVTQGSTFQSNDISSE